MTNTKLNQAQLQDEQLDAVVGGSFWGTVGAIAGVAGGVALIAGSTASIALTDGVDTPLAVAGDEAGVDIVTANLATAGLL